ncbi:MULTISPECIES: FAD-dependent oxidoreductase [Bacillaceae]|uniref:FAD-dependent oxidoreductase n=1 Tax=Evansella alkalicola TaxID=745819 RepID=A0ABS6JWV9_9BACI|nr:MULTISPECIES: FAD-dependent oxidoreductase [Bacillaceae]MBU9722875.1 FAD-dependent oxidoreductase [Bacillus alkalicola]
MYDILIIGAGPAGASAAIFSAKAGKKTLLIDNEKSLTAKAWVENHYGAPGISGPDLLQTGKDQATKLGAELKEATVTDIVKDGSEFTVKTEGEEYKAKHVLIATGVATDLAEKAGVDTVPATEPRIKTVIDVQEDGKTNVDGIWAAGTIAGVSVHTIITAGHGASVAINIISEINGERYVDHDILKA